MDKVYTSGYLCRQCNGYYKDEGGTEEETGNVAYVRGVMVCRGCRDKLGSSNDKCPLQEVGEVY